MQPEVRSVPRPTWSAMRSTDSLVLSRSSRAVSTRARRIHCSGVLPVSSAKRRRNVRGDIRACAASPAIVSGWSSCVMAHSRVAARVSPWAAEVVFGRYWA